MTLPAGLPYLFILENVLTEIGMARRKLTKEQSLEQAERTVEEGVGELPGTEATLREEVSGQPGRLHSAMYCGDHVTES